ncbi:conserved hypothetical protein [Ignisphaera aggregans DSM 17230]|uniref:Replication initiator protein WhiP n=1 Tax=Ignisphaera aggregans (strain DSM 17230 / JCM 13409 / AQ1.S1) TaxID=583356 RepID=E0SPN5_IGNAA|nr:conserved hypothetical protein [Ignisphaera aggregans DSM 17230]
MPSNSINILNDEESEISISNKHRETEFLEIPNSIEKNDTYTNIDVKGPRSRIVNAILLLLYMRPMKSSEIASIIGKNTKLVSSYLSYWKVRGYVVYRAGYWSLTKSGEEYVKIFLESLGIPVLSPRDVVQLAQKLTREQDLSTINNWILAQRSQEETEIQSFTGRQTESYVGKQEPKPTSEEINRKAIECASKILRSKDLLEDEMTVLSYLIKHYVEWNSTYVYLDQISEELHYPNNELVSILRKLQTKKLIYLYTDRRFGIRVGLGRTFKQLLDSCTSKNIHK